MALPCYADKECNGCTACYKIRESVGRCLICNKDIRAGDNALITSGGLICDDEDCLLEFALTEGEDKDIHEYIKLHSEDFLCECKDELLEAVFKKRKPEINLLDFVANDKMSYIEFWNDRNGYYILPSL